MIMVKRPIARDHARRRVAANVHGVLESLAIIAHQS